MSSERILLAIGTGSAVLLLIGWALWRATLR